MPRYALKIEYDGTPYSGWQRQREAMSVQGELEAALQKLQDAEMSVTGAGRTDSGVHATGQVADVEMTRDWDPFRLSEALNWHLKPAPIAILAAARVADDFSARFSARERQYLFRLVSRRAPMTLERDRVWRVNHTLDIEAMREAASHLIGTHDFTTFRSSICQAQSPVKTLDALEMEAIDLPHGTEYRFHIRARSFLHNQVRSFVGTLERVGCGAWTPDRVEEALAARDRAACGPVCPPGGLYLSKVLYPTDLF